MDAKRDELTLRYLGLAKAIGLKAARRTGRDPDQCIAAAYFGLLTAASRYSESKGVNFVSYAKHRINGAIRDWDRTKQERPDDSALAAELYGHPPESLSPSPDELLRLREAREVVAAAKGCLSREQARIVDLLYFDGKTCCEHMVRRIHKEALAKMRVRLESIGIDSVL